MVNGICNYRVYCETDAKYETVWATIEPTTCPFNGAHTITASKTAAIDCKILTPVVYDPVMEPVIPGASKVVANDRPAIEIQNAVTGFAAIQTGWPRDSATDAKVKAAIKFILKASGTGSNIRLAMKVKANALGEDSSGAFDISGFSVVPVTFTVLGEVFEGSIELDASAFNLDEALALQIGRDGNNEMGAGTNDDINVAIQIIAVKVEAY